MSKSSMAAKVKHEAEDGKIVVPPLPYEQNALEPVISANTLSFHHGKHHQAYATNLNKLLENSPLRGSSLEEIVVQSAKDQVNRGIFNNAAQVWNHTFYWHSMSPKGGGQPGGDLKARIEADLGGYDSFRKLFAEAATTQFGSGWAWLVLADGKLQVTKTGNAETPLAFGQTPLLTIDVWEHAYYLDYQNRRPDYINAWLDKLVNWEFVAANLGNAK